MGIFHLVVAILLIVPLVCMWRAPARAEITQRAHYNALGMLGIVLCSYFMIANAMVHMHAVAWRSAGYFTIGAAFIMCNATFIRISRRPASAMRKRLMFASGAHFIGHDDNLYERRYFCDTPVYILIAVYP